MKIMSERRFQAELEKERHAIYRQEEVDRRLMELNQRIDDLQRGLFDLRCKVEGPATTTEVRA